MLFFQHGRLRPQLYNVIGCVDITFNKINLMVILGLFNSVVLINFHKFDHVCTKNFLFLSTKSIKTGSNYIRLDVKTSISA